MCSLCALPTERTAFSLYSLRPVALTHTYKKKKKKRKEKKRKKTPWFYLIPRLINPQFPLRRNLERRRLSRFDLLQLLLDKTSGTDIVSRTLPESFASRWTSRHSRKKGLAARRMEVTFVAERRLCPWSWNQITAGCALISPSVCSEWKVACHFLPRSLAF